MNLSIKTTRLLLGIIFLLGVSYSALATTYYVSPNGNDSNDGTSQESPWKSISKVSTFIMQPGDSILFKAGGIWREELEITESGKPGMNIYYGRYGVGPNPKIYASEKAVEWSNTTGNIWKSATSLDNYSDEYYAGRIFFLKNDSISWGQYQGSNTSNLSEEFDYVVSGGSYYVYSPSDPDTRYDAIEVTQRRNCIAVPGGESVSYMEINGIDMKFGRQRGYDAGYPEQSGATDLIFRNCTIGYIGAQPSGSAYGISVWHSNFLAENNVITDCGRRGISINLYLEKTIPADYIHLDNIIIRNNIFKRGYHTTALDLSSQLTGTDTIENVYFYHNIIDDSDFESICESCESNQLFVQNGFGVNWVNNIYVFGNVFIQATARNILFEGSDTVYVWNNTIIGHNPNITNSPYANVAVNEDGANVYYENNIIYDNLPDNSMQNHGVLAEGNYDISFEEKDYNLYFSKYPKTDRNFSAHRVNSNGGMGYWNTNEWSSYISENSRFEQNSPSPQDPDFENYNEKNYRLNETSPAAGAGGSMEPIIITDPFGIKDTITKYDIAGNHFNTSKPSIGAYEFYQPDPTEANIVSFILAQQSGAASINSTTHQVNITVKFGTNLSSLSPTISVNSGASINPASGVSRNFTTPQNYTVTAQDGVTQQVWTVTVSSEAGSAENDILTFTLPQQTGPATINKTNHTVNIQVNFETNLTNLSPYITVSPLATISPASGVSRNFTTPQTYTVTAQNGTSQQVWTVTVTAVAGSAENDILTFTLPQQTGAASINKSNHTVSIQVDFGTNLTNLSPNITVSPFATINPASGVSRNFTTPQTYTVTAQNGTSQQVWTVTVSTVIPSTETDILSFTLAQQTGAASINTNNHSINIEVIFGTILTNLSPNISVSTSATINPGSGIGRDFSSPQTYTVTAEDGISKQDWKVTISAAEEPPQNQLPDVNTQIDEKVYRNFINTIDATGTTDPDNDELTFTWELPAGIIVSSVNGPIISYFAPENSESTLSIALIVNDSKEIITKNYSVSVSDFDPSASEIDVAMLEASSYEEGNEYDNVLDNNIGTRWSAEGESWLTFTLDNNATLSYLSVSFYQGDQREAYFDIQASIDNENWDNIVERSESCGITSDYQCFAVDNSYTGNLYKYVRLNGYMNSVSEWNSINEVKIFGIEEVSSTSAQSEESKDINIYPNPSSGIVFVELNQSSKIRIVNLSGSVIYDNYHSSNLVEIPYVFTRGLYLIEVKEDDNHTYTKKLVVL